MRKKITLLIFSMAVGMLCSVVAWGQINYTAPLGSLNYPDCNNNYGAGESTTITNNLMAAGSGKITLGGVANVIGHFSSGGNTTGNHSVANTAIYTAGGSSCHGSVASTAYMPVYPSAAMCGVLGTDWRFQQSAPTYSATTTVQIASGYTLATPLVLQQYYFLDIPWYYRTYNLYTDNVYVGDCGVSPNTYPDSRPVARVSETTNSTNNRGGYVPGHIIVHAGSHVRLTGDAQGDYSIGAGTHSNSYATLTFPAPAGYTNYSYSVMMDGSFRENTITTNGVVQNINKLAEHAVFGVNLGYYPTTKISTHAAGGTILIGSGTQGQDFMELTTTTSITAAAGGFTSNTVYTGTDLGVIGTANLGNYGNNSMTISYSPTLFGPTGNNVGTSAMQIYNHSCNFLRFNNQPLTLNINAAGYMLIEGYENVIFDIDQKLTASSTGRTIINGGNVFINAVHEFTGSAAPTIATDMYYSINAYKSGGTGGIGFCGNGNIRTTARAEITNSGDGHSFWFADNDIDLNAAVKFVQTNTGTGNMTWRANNDIFTNNSCNATDEGSVLFDIKGIGNVLINAGRHINTKGEVKFVFATGATGTLSLISDAGNIQTERQVLIEVNEDSNDILISAEDPASTGLGSGNIYTYDDVTITRNNTGQGKTDILAQRDIQTALVQFESNSLVGDVTNIISHLGDISLGYSTVNPSGTTCIHPIASSLSYDLNRFIYNVPVVATGGKLSVRSGYSDLDETSIPAGGGNIYFTHIDQNLAVGSNYAAEYSIPFSNKYYCGNSTYGTRAAYEIAGIIGGVDRCAVAKSGHPYPCSHPGLDYTGYNGELLFDAGTRGNIIFNNGALLNFQDGSGHARFHTRWGDIDMRTKFDATGMQGNLLFYANSEDPDKLRHKEICGCREQRNNVYLQDFAYVAALNSGSVFIGADNNIKLQYGGLQTIGTDSDPFYNDTRYPCGAAGRLHCDADTSVNRARHLILDFNGANSGGFAAVASDLIDVYRNLVYNGGTGSGMSNVPYASPAPFGTGTLHGEYVGGYGLYIKSQGNKDNWTKSDFDVNRSGTATTGAACDTDDCSSAYLHRTSRVTFHADARIYTEGMRSFISSPVLETFGNLELNTHNYGFPTGKTSITIQTDSLIMHDSLIIDGSRTTFISWSELPRSMPIFKLGHHRFTPPVAEPGCKDCYTHTKGTGSIANRSALDTVAVTFRNGASVARLHTLVADHAVITFLTDSFDNTPGSPVIDARFVADTFKVRNQVELWSSNDKKRSGHLELVSEDQMMSKNYAGIYTRHLHLEPIKPDCKQSAYSDLWIVGPLPPPVYPNLEVITSSTFGGFGTIHADVHVETEGRLAAGYASLGRQGNCYEQRAGTLKMNDLRLDKGAQLHVSIGTELGFNDEEADLFQVNNLTIYGTVFIYAEKRAGQQFMPGCYPIIKYNTVDDENLNNLELGTTRIDNQLLYLDFDEAKGIVYLCVGEIPFITIQRQVIVSQPPPGVTINPLPGVHYVPWGHHFNFSVKFDGVPYQVHTNRLIEPRGGDSEFEILSGVLNVNGEYEYTLPIVKTQPVYIYIGPTRIVANESIDNRAVVWSHGNTVHINVSAQDIASIYSITGLLIKRIEVPEGGIAIPMQQRGVYIVTLKDGAVHKVIIR